MTVLISSSPCELLSAGLIGAALAVLLFLAPKLIENWMCPPGIRYLCILARCNWTSASVHVFARFGVADILADGPPEGLLVEEIAEKAGAHPDSLARVLRFMTHLEYPLIRINQCQRYTLTTFGRHFCTNHPDSCKALALTWQGQVHINARSKAYESIRSGQPGYRHAYGMEYENVWDVLADEDRKSGTAKEGRTLMVGPRAEVPCETSIFTSMMTAMSRPFGPHLAHGYPSWGKAKRIADFGGASGEIVKAILMVHGKTIERAFVVDLPQVIENQDITEAVTEFPQMRFVAADFFKPPPSILLSDGGLDIAHFKFILHDWADQECVLILRNIRPALQASGGKLLLVEHVLPVPPYTPYPTGSTAVGLALALDLEMMTANGGKERTKKQWEAILEDAGFKAQMWRPIAGYVYVVEALPTRN